MVKPLKNIAPTQSEDLFPCFDIKFSSFVTIRDFYSMTRLFTCAGCMLQSPEDPLISINSGVRLQLPSSFRSKLRHDH